MALQGTIDTFPVTDVLTLIASSSRSGRLTLTGDRGTVAVWLDRDIAVAGQTSDEHVVSAERAIFELLRFVEGSFVFESVARDDFPETDVDPVPTDTALAGARVMVEEWERIEALVPSNSHRVGLVAELSSEDVTIDASTWRTLVTITRSSSVGHLALELGLDDHDVAVLVASLVEDGLVEVTDPWDIDSLLADEGIPTSSNDDDPPFGDADRGTDDWGSDDEDSGRLAAGISTGPSANSTDPTPVAVGGHSGVDTSDVPAEFPEHFPIDDLIPDVLGTTDDPWGVEQPQSVAGAPQSATGGADVPDPSEWTPSGTGGMEADAFAPQATADESAGVESSGGAASQEQGEDVLRQMSTLSPSAAEAIAATLAGEELHDPSAPENAGRQRRGLFRGSGLFGTGGHDDAGVSDDPVEPTVAPQVEEVVADPGDAGGGTSISYLDSF